MIAEIGEELQTDYSLVELPGHTAPQMSSSDCALINQAVISCIELLEAENAELRNPRKKQGFRIEDIQHNDKLVRFYTGFVSFCFS